VTLSNRIVAAVAEQKGVEPEALETSLSGAVDRELIDALDSVSDDDDASPYPVVEFVYCGHTVWVDGNGNITVSGRVDTGGSAATETLYRSLDDLSGEKAHRKAAMAEAADVVAARDRSFEERLDGLLEIVRETLGLEAATLSYVNDDAYVFEAVDSTPGVELQAGRVIRLADTVCQRVVETEESLVLQDIHIDAPELADTGADIAFYMGVPVFVDGEVYGTFCFYDSEPRDEELSEWERTFVELLSRFVSSELERRNRERTLKAATTERPSGRS
jgi:putative methionine-R-sulfoxide reductase with GAF domain